MRSKGNYGESLAKTYLIQQGFHILKQNFYTQFGEIDIIAAKQKTIHIIEVKYTSRFYIDAIYKINRKKIRRMIQTTQIYMDQSKLFNQYYQFDLITIIDDQVKYYPQIFSLTDYYR